MFRIGLLRAFVAIAVLSVDGSISAAQKPKEWNPVIDPANFVSGVNNPYFPLTPGTTTEFSGTTKDGNETLTIEVPRRHKTILGVETMVVIETGAIDGQVVEIAENWFAQDRNGNVWYFGEFTQEFLGGAPISTAGSWEAGVNDAKPGIIMPAQPSSGLTYFQEYAPGVAQDMATVMKTNETLTVPYGNYTAVLETKESNPLEGGSIERKFYAPGIGLIQEDKGTGALTLTAVH
jgi:hypothetical protein